MKTHRTDLASLIPGLAFVGIALAALSEHLGVDLAVDLRWLWPTLLIGLGVLLLAGLGGGRSSDSVAAEVPALSDDPAPSDATEPLEDEADRLD